MTESQELVVQSLLAIPFCTCNSDELLKAVQASGFELSQATLMAELDGLKQLGLINKVRIEPFFTKFFVTFTDYGYERAIQHIPLPPDKPLIRCNDFSYCIQTCCSDCSTSLVGGY